MQTGWKVVGFSFFSFALVSLTACAPGSGAAPIHTIHNFGEVSAEVTSERSDTPMATSEPVDDEDRAMQRANSVASSQSQSSQLVVNKNWDYQRPQASAPKTTFESATPQAVNVHSIVEGTLISNEGGIATIQAQEGAKVRSAAQGSVIYTGPSVQGDGRMVIVKDDEGTLFAYSHLGTLSVPEGRPVNRSDVLGTAAEEPLIFQVRKQNGAVDPKRYLVS
jgi:hypothetical protein